VMTGIRLAPQATLTLWHAVLIIVGTLYSPSRKIKPVRIIAVVAVLGLVLRYHGPNCNCIEASTNAIKNSPPSLPETQDWN